MSVDIDQLSTTTAAAVRSLLEDPIFEVIPLSNASEQVASLPTGARVSVTASPNKTLDESLDLCAEFLDRGFRVTPHLSARMTQDIGHVERLLGRIGELGITSVFVVGGDAEFTGEFYDGLSLLQAMDKVGHHLEVGIPSYPEGHPDIPDDSLAGALRDKEEYAGWLTTQMCFDGEALDGWLRLTRSEGIGLPAVLGLPGPADRKRLLGISARIGVGRSMSFLRKNTGLVSAFVRPGGYDPLDLLVELGDRLADPHLDIDGLHIYTFNQCDATAAWREQILERL